MKINLKLFLLLLVFNSSLFGQNSIKNADDLQRISFAVYIPPQIENLSSIAKDLLTSKLNQIAVANGLGGNSFNERFIITTNINIITKDLTPTAPSMTALNLDITFFLGDGVDGKKFASTSISAKGVGETETKAYIQAIKTININNSIFKNMFETGRNKIIEYYNSRCDFIIKQAQISASQNKFDEAIYTLVSIPEVCKTCYLKAMDAVAPIYKRKIDRQCQIDLTNAKSTWAANQNYNGANEVAIILTGMDPNASCYSEANKLITEISSKIKKIDNREWDFKLQENKDQAKLQNNIINSIRAIGVAYGNHQPNQTYNFTTIHTWW